MIPDNRADLTRLAAELYYLREDARLAGEPFLAFLIQMAAVEAERLGDETRPPRRRLRLVWPVGEVEKPVR